VKAVYAQGSGVIVDVVYNHLGPSDLDLWQFDGWSENEKDGIFRICRDLITLRRNRSGVTQGLCGQNIHIFHFNVENAL
jgi:hypothetical protein